MDVYVTGLDILCQKENCVVSQLTIVFAELDKLQAQRECEERSSAGLFSLRFFSVD
jgi:hypothetical protein